MKSKEEFFQIKPEAWATDTGVIDFPDIRSEIAGFVIVFKLSIVLSSSLFAVLTLFTYPIVNIVALSLPCLLVILLFLGYFGSLFDKQIEYNLKSFKISDRVEDSKIPEVRNNFRYHNFLIYSLIWIELHIFYFIYRLSGWLYQHRPKFRKISLKPLNPFNIIRNRFQQKYIDEYL